MEPWGRHRKAVAGIKEPGNTRALSLLDILGRALQKCSVSIYLFHRDDLELPNANSGRNRRSKLRRHRRGGERKRKVMVEGAEKGKRRAFRRARG